MSVFSFITDLFKPATKLIDDLHYSGHEKAKSKEKLAQLKNELATIQSKANSKFLDLEMAALQARKEVMIAESKSTSKLQSSWRPICSILLILLVVLDSFGIVNANQDLYTLAMSFLGLYGFGRSVEKTADTVKLGK